MKIHNHRNKIQVRRSRLGPLIFVGLALGIAVTLCRAADGPVIPGPPTSKKVLVTGRGNPFRESDGGPTHPQGAKDCFLALVANLPNDAAKGWTVEFSYDLMRKLGMDPTNTPLETFFDYIGSHHLEYPIIINNSPRGQAEAVWEAALRNGCMPFAAQGLNMANHRIDDPPGLRAAIGVAGGTIVNQTSYGPSVEFIDAVPIWLSHTTFEDAAQSWANQVVAAKFAHILDTHPRYNIYDARQHLRQAASYFSSGWNETNGYGRVNPEARVDKLEPAPPLEFALEVSRDGLQVAFTWRNFLQSDFAATVIAREDGRVIYEGQGTNFAWNSDVTGEETFTYWSRNTAGDRSRIESYQVRKVGGLKHGLPQSCLVLGAPPGEEALDQAMARQFQQLATNWVCDVAFRRGNPDYDKWTVFPRGSIVAVLPDFAAMVSYAIEHPYRLLLVPATYQEGELYRYKAEWDRATAAGRLVIVAHQGSVSKSRAANARRISPPRLFSAITVGAGLTNNLRSFGPGLEFFDQSVQPPQFGEPTQNEAVPMIAIKLARIFDANPSYNQWDARQHLRQISSYYPSGWVEDGGYGKPVNGPWKLPSLDPAPPLEIEVAKSTDSRTVTFSWENFRQSSFAETMIQRRNGQIIYHGTDTRFAWPSDVEGAETFEFFSRDNAGRLSRRESYTQVTVQGLHPAQR